MTGPVTTTPEEAVERIMAELCRAADATIANKRGAALMAMDPARRAHMESAHTTFARWIPALKKAHAKLVAADAVVVKALRTHRPRIVA